MLRVGLSSARLCQFALAVLAATACGGANPAAGTSPSAHLSTASAATSASPVEPSPIPKPVTVSCGARPSGGPMVMLSGILYDVTDPVHPRRLCVVSNTSAHIWTGDTFTYLKPDTATSTAVVLHSIGSGNESVAGKIPYPGLEAGGVFASTWWAPDGSIAATAVHTGDRAHVRLYTSGFTGELFSYPYPAADCICRFGVPPPVLSISPDRQYLVAGWPIGKGAAGLSVYQLSNRTLVTTLDAAFGVAMWDKAGHRLFISGTGGSASWTPEGGQVMLGGAQQWSYLAGRSPDGTQIAYTAYLDAANPMSLRVFVYDVKTDQTRMLRDALRSQVIFVKGGWVWYLEETQCDASDTSCGSWHTKPTGKVLAMSLADGVERQVDFLYAEETTGLVPGEFWPNA